MKKLKYRRATISDLPAIVNLLLEDELGKTREKQATGELDLAYRNAFSLINVDPNQFLMVVINNDEIVGTCHLTIMPSLTYAGSTRMQLEAVRVAEKYRGQQIGAWMIHAAIEYGKSKNVSIMQLTTNKKRRRTRQFYERLGFEDTHVGMKMYNINQIKGLEGI